MGYSFTKFNRTPTWGREMVLQSETGPSQNNGNAGKKKKKKKAPCSAKKMNAMIQFNCFIYYF